MPNLLDLPALDLFVVVAWLALTLVVGVRAGLHATTSVYWVNDRSTRRFPLIASIVSTQVGAGAIIGIASATYQGGTGFALVSLCSTVFGFLAVAGLAPRLKRIGDTVGAVTLPELLRVRYGRSTQRAAACIILFTYLSLLAAQFLATSSLLAAGTALSLRGAILATAVVVVAYSAFAGTRGDIATDLLHFIVMGAVLLLALVPLIAIAHPFGEWVDQIPGSIWSPVTFGGWSFLIVGLLAGIVVPVLQPELWIKVYASRNPAEGRAAMFSSALWVIPFYAAAMYLGLVAYAAFGRQAVPDTIVYQWIGEVMPTGLLGLALAAILAIVVSTANTLIVVIAGSIVRDLFPGKADNNLAAIRVVGLAAGVLGVALAYAVPNLVQTLLNGFYMLLVLGPSVIGLFFWRRATVAAASVSITLGGATTMVFLFVAPAVAFLPGLIVSTGTFLVVAAFSKHGQSERPDIGLASPKSAR